MTTQHPRIFGRLNISAEEDEAARRAFLLADDGASLTGFPSSDNTTSVIRGWRLGVANSTVTVNADFTNTMSQLPDYVSSLTIMILLPTPQVDGGIYSKLEIKAKEINGVYSAGTYNATYERMSNDSKGVASSGANMGHIGGFAVYFCYATLGGAYKLTLQETTPGRREVYVLEVFKVDKNPREVGPSVLKGLRDVPISFRRCYLDSVEKTPARIKVSSTYVRRDIHLADELPQPRGNIGVGGDRDPPAAVQPSAASVISESVQRIEDVVVSYSNILDVINSGVNKGKYYDEKLTRLAIVDFTPPQYMDIEDARKVSESILEYLRNRFGGSSPIYEMMGLIALIQNAVTYSTVQNANISEKAGVVITYAGDSYLFPYNDFIREIEKTICSREYSNKLRKYMRWWSATTISLVKVGIIKPNFATQASHGVVKAYIPYCFDFVALDSRYNTKDEKIAAGLARYVAVKNKLASRRGGNEDDLHNTVELFN